MRKILYVLVVATPQVFAAGDFPAAPPGAAAAATRGLERVDMAELKKLFAGTRIEQDANGKIYQAQYGADGSVILGDSSGLIDRGTFTIVRQNGGGLCLRLEQQMNQRMCAIWFFAGDGVHLFGYNPTDGALRAVSRPATD